MCERVRQQGSKQVGALRCVKVNVVVYLEYTRVIDFVSIVDCNGCSSCVGCDRVMDIIVYIV